MHQAETAKKLRGLPAFFYSHRCVPRLLDFLIAAGKLFFWPSFLRGSKSRKNHSNQNCPRGEGAIAKSTIIHRLHCQLNAKKGPLVIVNALLFVLFRKLDLWRPEGPYATKKQLCICELVLLLLLQYTSFNQGPLWPLNLRLTIACLQSIRPCNLYWIIKYVNLVFEDQRTSNVLLLKV